jgi:hypothetical protein
MTPPSTGTPPISGDMESLNIIPELAACPTVPATSNTDHGQTP